MTVSNIDIEYRSIQLFARFPRVATFIPSNFQYSKAILLHVIELHSQMWGGAQAVVVPIRGDRLDPAFQEILTRYDPDYLQVYEPKARDLKDVAPQEFRIRLDATMEQMRQANPGLSEEQARANLDQLDWDIMVGWNFDIPEAITSSLTHLCNPFDQFGSLYSKRNRASRISYPMTDIGSILTGGPNQRVENFEVEDDIDLRLMIYSKLGHYSEDYYRTLNAIPNAFLSTNRLTESDLASVWSYVGIGQGTLMDDRQIPKTPFTMSVGSSGKYYARPGLDRTAPPVLVIGNDVDDICFALSLDRIRGEAFWIPSQWLHTARESEEIDAAGPSARRAYMLAAQLILYAQANRDGRLYLTTISASDEELKEAAGVLTGIVGTPRVEIIPAGSPRVYANRFVYLDHFSNSREAFLNGSLARELETPRPGSFLRLTSEHAWLSEAHIENAHLPPRRELTSLVIETKNYGEGELRLSRDGVCYFCPNIILFGGDVERQTVRPWLNIPRPLDIAQRLAAAGGLDPEISDKGLYMLRTVARFGNLHNLAFRVKTDRNLVLLLDKYADLSRPAIGDFSQGVVLGDRRRYLPFDAIALLLGADEAAASLVNDLVERAVLHRGFVFKCFLCRQAAWYALRQVSDTFDCVRCGQTQQIGSEQLRLQLPPRANPTIHYRLEEVVFQAHTNRMTAPILALDYLSSQSTSFMYIPGLDLFRHGQGKIRIGEIDLFCISDGRLILGEAKSIDTLANTAAEENDTVTRYVDFCRLLRADQIVFSTSASNWSPGTLTRIREAFHTAGIPVALLANGPDGMAAVPIDPVAQ